jgi:hypothetical protein
VSEDTPFIGISIQIVHTAEYSEYWILDTNGGEEYYGYVRPTEYDVIDYRNRAIRAQQ